MLTNWLGGQWTSQPEFPTDSWARRLCIDTQRHWLIIDQWLSHDQSVPALKRQTSTRSSINRPFEQRVWSNSHGRLSNPKRFWRSQFYKEPEGIAFVIIPRDTICSKQRFAGILRMWMGI